MTKYVTQLEKKFEDWRSALANALNHAKAHIEAWSAIEEYRVDHVNELNIAPSFWGLTRKAHLHAGLLNLSILLDKNRRSVSLPRWLDWIEQHLSLFSDDKMFTQRLLRSSRIDEDELESRGKIPRKVTREFINAHREKIHSFDTDIEYLKAWRDKVLAHRDADFLKKGELIEQVYPLLLPRITESLIIFEDILNFYSLAYDSSSYAFNVTFKHGLEGMIQILAEWQKARSTV